MKFKIIASVIVLLIIIVALALKGCSTAQPATDENGNPVDTTTTDTTQQQ
jgi:PBP1b-binding outer membrane lipoprotein LpoB